jgi:thiol-disulfide isomerase/thioredoxin
MTRKALPLLIALTASVGVGAQGNPYLEAIDSRAARLITSGDAAGLRALLAAEPALATAGNHVRWTLLHFAVSDAGSNPVEISAILLDHGADVNAKEGELNTPLHFAVRRQPVPGRPMKSLQEYESLIQLLLNRGADVHARNIAGATPLHLAVIRRAEPRALELLLDGGARVSEKTTGPDAWTPLHGASGSGRLDLVNVLLSRGADPAIVDGQGLTPLQAAERAGHAEIAARLRTPASPASPASILGTWVYVSATGGRGTNPTAVGTRMKVFTDRGWHMTQTNPMTGQVTFHHGGSYTLTGSEYVERVEYANANTQHLVNSVGRFTVTVTADTLTQAGFQPGSGSRGMSMTEVWKRVPPGIMPIDVAKAAGGVIVTPTTGRGAPVPAARGTATPSARGVPPPGPTVSLSLVSSDPRVTAALQEGETALRGRQHDAALDAFKRAHNLSKKSSAAALFGMSRAYHALGAYKDEADACADALKLGGDDKTLAALLHNQRGLALAAQAGTTNDQLLGEAEAAFRAAIELDPTVITTRYNLGFTLLKRSKDDEGKAVLAKFVEDAGGAPDVASARRLIENPRRARENYAPDFRATTFEGRYLVSQELVGKTVLLDFWGTWCPPCLAATPDLVKLQRKFAGDGFLMMGISSDQPSQESAVRDYVARHQMAWPQNLDSTRQVHTAFQVRVFPTYIVIDAEGIIRERVEGWRGGETIRRLENAIQRSLKAGAAPQATAR